MSALEPIVHDGEAHRPTVERLTLAVRGLQESAEKQLSSVVRILHDDLGGLLVSAMMDLSWIKQHRGSDGVAAKLERVHQSLAAAVDLKRNLIESLRPSILDNFGLAAAFRWHLTHTCEHAATLCTYTLPEVEPKLRPEALIALFRIGQETLSAALAESLLKRVDFSMGIQDERLLLEVTHEHHEAETVDMLHSSTNLYATIQRIDALNGSWSILRLATGSVVRAAFPWSAISPT
jgi:signal transduction histidine kinase